MRAKAQMGVFMIQNPILRGFCPDPSIIRVGEDYYIATSTFEWWPGIHLFHSKDLKHWEQLPSPITRRSQADMIGNPTSGGIWAPCLSYSDGIYYIVYTDVKTKKGRFYNNHNYLIQSNAIDGEWSEPIYLNSTGFDPSLFHDRDGRKYLVNMRNGFKGILLQEFDTKEKKLIGEVKNIFKGTVYGYTEGPHLYHRSTETLGEYYYLITAEGGTGYGHCVTVARARDIWGPYEVDPNNPMLTSKEDDGSILKKCGHADFTDTSHGDWYMVHLCSRPREGTKESLLGRETAIQKVEWSEDGWLRLCNQTGKAALEVEEPIGVASYPVNRPVARDDFNGEVLDVVYSSPRIPLGENASLSERAGYLRLYGQESLNSLHRVSLLARRQTEYHAKAMTGLEFKPSHPEQVAGITYFYDAMNHYIFGKSVNEEGREVLILLRSDTGVYEDLIEPLELEQHNQLHLMIETDKNGAFAYFSYSYDGIKWNKVTGEYSTKILTDEHCRGFTGAHFGIFCFDMTGLSLPADFDYFHYEG